MFIARSGTNSWFLNHDLKVSQINKNPTKVQDNDPVKHWQQILSLNWLHSEPSPAKCNQLYGKLHCSSFSLFTCKLFDTGANK